MIFVSHRGILRILIPGNFALISGTLGFQLALIKIFWSHQADERPALPTKVFKLSETRRISFRFPFNRNNGKPMPTIAKLIVVGTSLVSQVDGFLLPFGEKYAPPA